MKSFTKSKNHREIANLTKEDGSTEIDITGVENMFNKYFNNISNNLSATLE